MTSGLKPGWFSAAEFYQGIKNENLIRAVREVSITVPGCSTFRKLRANSLFAVGNPFRKGGYAFAERFASSMLQEPKCYKVQFM